MIRWGPDHPVCGALFGKGYLYLSSLSPNLISSIRWRLIISSTSIGNLWWFMAISSVCYLLDDRRVGFLFPRSSPPILEDHTRFFGRNSLSKVCTALVLSYPFLD